MIAKYSLIPLTALTSLNTMEKGLLLGKGIVLSKALLDRKVLEDLNFDDRKIRSIQDEVNELAVSLKEAL